MATETEQLVVSLEARVRDFERNFQRANRAANDNFGKIENRARKSAKRLEQSMANAATGMSNRLKAVAGTLAAAFSTRELIALTDSYTRFSNQLKVAGLEGSDLAVTQNRLFDIAQKYGVQLEAVATLYGRNAASAKEMNLTQEDQLRIVEATSAALKTSGQSSTEAAGALLQLSQALGGSKIQAEEYNSLIDGARPLLQAVAAGSDRWGGSVAKLTADVKAGNVATRDFVQALLKGADGAIAQAGKATLTTSAAFETLRNAMVKYFGEADQVNGATAALADAIKVLADNLDTVIPALATLSTALGVGFVTNAARAAIAARGVGGALLAAFGGPVGIAITGITVALAGLYSETVKTRAALDSVEAITGEAARTLNEAKGKADNAAAGVAGVGKEAATSETKVRAFAGAVGEAAQKLYDLAKARQVALISDLQAKRQQASLQYTELYKQSDRGLKARVGAGLSWDSFKADVTLAGRKLGILKNPEDELQQGMEDLKGAMSDYDAAIRDARDNLERFAAQPSTSSTASGTSSKGTGNSRTTDAERAAEAEKRLQERVNKTTEDLRLQLRLSDLRAQGMDLQADREQAIADIHQQFPELVNSSNAKLREQLSLMEALAIAGVERAHAEQQFEQQQDEAKAVFAARKAARERERQEAQQQISSLADFYESAFTGRGANLWASFRQQGLRAVADVLARFTFSLFDGKPGNLFGFASGGQIQGPGTGTSDSIVARVSNGEFVVNAAATRKYLPLLETINGGKAPAFATGGIVGGSRASAQSAAALAFNTSATINIKGDQAGGFNKLAAERASEALKAETAKFMERWVQNELRPGGRLASRR